MSNSSQVEQDGDGDGDADGMFVDVVGVRMRCLELALTECKDSFVDVGTPLILASAFAAFVLDGITPAKH